MRDLLRQNNQTILILAKFVIPASVCQAKSQPLRWLITEKEKSNFVLKTEKWPFLKKEMFPLH